MIINKIMSSVPVSKVCLILSMLLQTTISPTLYAGPVLAPIDNPIRGSGSVDVDGTNTLITQTSKHLAIDWQSFDVNSNESVTFDQSSSSQVVLNRVVGFVDGDGITQLTGTNINGTISAQGTVFIINEKGVLFSEGATINVRNLVAAALNIDPDEFVLGNYSLSGGQGSVINQGLLQASLGGSINLIGHVVENQGEIRLATVTETDSLSADVDDQVGQVNLIAASSVDISFGLDKLIGITVTGQDLVNLNDAQSSVLNSGNGIFADGGTVMLSGTDASSIFDNAVNNSGVISAKSITGSEGQISLIGSGDIVVNNELIGDIDINALGTGSVTTGTLQTQGGNISVSSGSLITLGAIQTDGANVSLKANDFNIQGAIQAPSIEFTQDNPDNCIANCQLTLAGENSVIDNTELSLISAESWIFNTVDDQSIVLEGDVEQSGLQLDFQSALEVSGSRSLNVGDQGSLVISGTLDGFNDSELNTLNISGPINLGGNVGTTVDKQLASLTIQNDAVIGADTIITSGSQTYNGNVSISDLQIQGSEAVFNQTLDGSGKLSVSGDLYLNGAVGSVEALQGITVTQNSNINTNTITTTGDQTYNGVTLQNTTTLDAQNVTIQSLTATNEHGLTINGNAVLSEENIALTDLNISGTAVLSGRVVTQENQSYGGVELNSHLSMQGKNININKVSSDIDYDLTITGSESVELGNLGAADTRIGALSINAPQTLIRGSSFISSLSVESQALGFGELAQPVDIDVLGSAELRAPIQLNSDLTLTSQQGNIVLEENITAFSGEDLTLSSLNGSVRVQGPVDAGSLSIEALSVELMGDVDTLTGSGVISLDVDNDLQISSNLSGTDIALATDQKMNIEGDLTASNIALTADGDINLEGDLSGSNVELSSEQGSVFQSADSRIVTSITTPGGSSSSGTNTTAIVKIDAKNDIELSSVSAESGNVVLISGRSVTKNKSITSAKIAAETVAIKAETSISDLTIDGSLAQLNSQVSFNILLGEDTQLITTGFSKSLTDIASEVSGSQRQVDSDLGDVDPAIFTELSIYSIEEDGIKITEEDFY